MASLLLTYLRRHVLSDERTVNRLFVSVFIESNSLIVKHSKFLSGFIINNGDEDFGLLQDVSGRIKAEYGEKIILETLVKLFEFVISPADRVVTGAIYTPVRIRETILQKCIGDKCVDDLNRLRIADIACGCGGFLMNAAQYIHYQTGKPYADIFRENIFGIDVQKYSIERTKILLSLLALTDGEDADFSFNLLCGDTLDFASDNWDETYNGFDVIVGNPPYVCSRNLPENTRLKMKGYEVCGSGHPDLYIPFFQIAIEMLNEGGRMGYITMNTFLRSVNGRSLRKYFRRNNCELTVLDFRGHQVFESRNTYTCLFYYDKAGQDAVIHYAVDEQGSLSKNILFTSVSYNVLDDDKGWSLNDINIAFAIESTGVKIKDYCPSRHGIATLSNDTYIFQPIREDDRYYYLEKNGTEFPIEKEICRRVFNPNRLTADGNIETSYELIIFPYIYDNGSASVVSPERMSNEYPCTLKYLETRRKVLLLRDKGNTRSYPQWYAFGRTQSLILPRYKLFFPKFSNKPIRCILVDDPDLMLYNGLAFVNSDIRKLEVLKRVIESKLFWRYVVANAKPYASGYYSLSGVDINHFGIPVFSLADENELLSIGNKDEIEHWLIAKYGLADSF